MNNQVNPKLQVGCFTILIIMILLVSYFAAGTINPLTVYTSGSIWGKIVISFLASLIASSLIQFLWVNLSRKFVEKMSGKPIEDLICPGCGLPLIQYVGSHGLPIKCPKCRRLYHNGPACYNKDMPQKTSLFPTYPCLICREEASHDQDLFDEESCSL